MKRFTLYLLLMTFLSNAFANDLPVKPAPSTKTFNSALEQRISNWNAIPYVGLQYGLPGIFFAGYGKTFGAKQNYYLAGEAFMITSVITNPKPIGGGISINPGILVTPRTLLYSRLGVANVNDYGTGLIVGLGVQTNLNKHVDFRAEINNALVQVGLVYKFNSAK